MRGSWDLPRFRAADRTVSDSTLFCGGFSRKVRLRFGVLVGVLVASVGGRVTSREA